MNYVKTEGATHVLISIKELEKYISKAMYHLSMQNTFYRFDQVEIKDGKIIRSLPKTKVSGAYYGKGQRK